MCYNTRAFSVALILRLYLVWRASRSSFGRCGEAVRWCERPPAIVHGKEMPSPSIGADNTSSRPLHSRLLYRRTICVGSQISQRGEPWSIVPRHVVQSPAMPSHSLEFEFADDCRSAVGSTRRRYVTALRLSCFRTPPRTHSWLYCICVLSFVAVLLPRASISSCQEWIKMYLSQPPTYRLRLTLRSDSDDNVPRAPHASAHGAFPQRQGPGLPPTCRSNCDFWNR